MAVHDVGWVERACERVLVLHGGVCVADGEPREVLTRGVMGEVFGEALELVEGAGGERVWGVSANWTREGKYG